MFSTETSQDNVQHIVEPSAGVYSAIVVEGGGGEILLSLFRFFNKERSEAEREQAAMAIISASCFDRNQNIKNNYKNRTIIEDAISKLHGVKLINGDLMDMQIAILKATL